MRAGAEGRLKKFFPCIPRTAGLALEVRGHAGLRKRKTVTDQIPFQPGTVSHLGHNVPDRSLKARDKAGAAGTGIPQAGARNTRPLPGHAPSPLFPSPLPSPGVSYQV